MNRYDPDDTYHPGILMWPAGLLLLIVGVACTVAWFYYAM